MNPPKPFQISRRSFIRRVSASAAATGLPLWFVERELARAEEPAKTIKSPNDRPNIALIGCGGMGTGDARNARRFGEIVAVCDVDSQHLDRAVKTFTSDAKVPEKFSDFRKLLERDDIHAVINGTREVAGAITSTSARACRRLHHSWMALHPICVDGPPRMRSWAS